MKLGWLLVIVAALIIGYNIVLIPTCNRSQINQHPYKNTFSGGENSVTGYTYTSPIRGMVVKQNHQLNIKGEVRMPGNIWGTYVLPVEINDQISLTKVLLEVQNGMATRVRLTIDGYNHKAKIDGNEDDMASHAQIYRKLVGRTVTGEWKGTAWKWTSGDVQIDDDMAGVLSRNFDRDLRFHSILPEMEVGVGDSWALTQKQVEDLFAAPDAVKYESDINATFEEIVDYREQRCARVVIDGNFEAAINGKKHGRYTVEAKIRKFNVMIAIPSGRIVASTMSANCMYDYPNASSPHTMQVVMEGASSEEWMVLDD